MCFCLLSRLDILSGGGYGDLYTDNMLFFAGFCFSLAIIFSLSVAISRLSERVKKLSQEIALLKGTDGDEEENTLTEGE